MSFFSAIAAIVGIRWKPGFKAGSHIIASIVCNLRDDQKQHRRLAAIRGSHIIAAIVLYEQKGAVKDY